MIELVIPARRKDLGGFEVGRVLPFPQRRMVGPFIFLDHMGPADFGPGGGIDVRPHPHIGLSTVTYLFAGEIMHRDSTGAEQAIRPGEVNWMTAGRGIVHSERTDPSLRAAGWAMHGMQAWVALPEGQEEADPFFRHHAPEDLPTYEADGIKARLIAGSAFGARADVQVSSPLMYVHWELEAGAVAGVPADHPERAAYIASGEVEVDGRSYGEGQMLVFAPAEGSIALKALRRSTVMLIGGEPVGPRHIWWNLVSSSRERIDQARADWAGGRFPMPPTDHDEWIPLPADPPPPPEPMS